MARSRNIKPGFFRNETLVELPYETRLLFIGLWTIADREGRLEDRPKRIKMELFPADDLNVDTCLQALHDSGFILRYQVEDVWYIQVVNFHKHQNPHHKEQESTIPAPDGYQPEPVKHDANPGHAPDMTRANPGHAVLDSLNTDSPFSDSLNPEVSAAGATDSPPSDDPPTPDPPKPEPIPKPQPGKPMPRNGTAQTMLAVLYEDVLKIGPPTNYRQALGQAQRFAKDGATVEDVERIGYWLLADAWHADKGITITTVINSRDKWRSSQNAPKPPNGSMRLVNGGKVGRDGLTDEERGWRENPGPKGWTADEAMRMSLAMEQQERRERNSA